jgi:hypothetical protein
MKENFEKIKNSDIGHLKFRLFDFAKDFEERSTGIVDELFSPIEKIAKFKDFSDFSVNAPKELCSPTGLDKYYETVKRLEYINSISAELISAQKYLAGMTIPTTNKNLMVRLESIASRMSLKNILSGSADPSILLGEFERFKEEYVRFYVHEHNEFQRQLNEMSTRIEDTKARIFALDLLSVIPEIVDKRGKVLPVEFARIEKKLKLCKIINEDEFALLRHPYCKCKFMPDDDNPIELFLDIEDDIEQSYTASTKRLSLAPSKKITAKTATGDLEKLIQAITLSDLMGIKNVLTHELTESLVRIFSKEE